MDTISLKNPRQRMLIEWIMGLIALVILGGIFFGGYGGLDALKGWIGMGSQTVGDNPSGTLFISAIAASSTANAGRIANFILPITENAVRYIPVDQLAAGNAVTLQYDISANSSWATFLGSNASASSSSRALSVYRAHLSGSTYDEMISSLQSAIPVASSTTNSDSFREFPVVSSSGTILYSTLSGQTFAISKKGSIGAIPADDWSIMIADGKNGARIVTQGLRPKWVDATHFAFLKNDGVYLYSLSEKAAAKVYGLDFVPTIVNSFDVSDDGQFIAISKPVQNTLSIIRALDWNSGLVAKVADVAGTLTYPVFSPDDHYVAMLSLAPDQSDPTRRTPAATIRYYSLDRKQFTDISLPIDSSLVSSIYITDWK